MIRITDQYFWNFVFLIFFIILIVMGSIILETESRIAFSDLTLVDYVLIVLASLRLTQLFAVDSVTRFFREQFWDLKKIGRGYKLEKPKNGPRSAISDLIDCSWSFGLWSTATVTFFYLITPYAIFPVVLLALSSVVAIAHVLTKFVTNRV